MGDHYIPRFYLRGFTSNGAINGTIWAHDRVEERSFATQPKSIANETAMYPARLEKYITEQVEEPANAVITKIKEFKTLNDQDRLALARYIIVMWKRVPQARARVHGRLPDVSTSVRRDLHKKFDQAAKIHPDLAEAAEHKKAQVDQIIDKYLKDPPAELWHKTVEEQATPRMISAMLAMTWDFMLLKKGQFLTSDNPVFFFPEDGIGRPTSELTIPFAKNIALWAHHQKTGGVYRDASNNEMREINRRTATASTRYMYSASNEPWILEFACKTKHPLVRMLQP